MLSRDSYYQEKSEEVRRYDEDEDENDALSFCDLPIYGNGDAENESDASFRCSSTSSSSSSSSINEEGDDCFEFSFSSTQSLKESWVSNHGHESIMFCGKIIPAPQKQHPFPNKYSRSTLKYQSSQGTPLKEKGVHLADGKRISASRYKTSKWFLLMFGLVRIQGPMDLKDIKKRQKKTSRQSSHRPTSLVCEEDSLKSGGKGMWSLLRGFSCTSTCEVKASLWCVQQLRAAQ